MSDLSAEAFLLQFAQASLAFAGFAGVVGIVRPRAGDKLVPQEKVGLKLILESAIGAGLAAFFPIPLWHTVSYFSGEEFLVWRISSLMLAALLMVGIVVNIMRMRELARVGARARVEWGLRYVLLPGTALMVGLLLFAVWQGGKWAYSWALFWMLFLAGIQFFVFLVMFKIEHAE